MARQKVEDNLFYVIFRHVPTWATVAVVAASYPVLRWLLPAVAPGNLSVIILSAFAPWLTLALVLIALFAEADKYSRRRLVSRQSSLETLRAMTWLEFEHLVGETYRQQGYKVEEKGGSGPDGGVDIILRRGGEAVLVQCKRWKNQSVDVKPLRELRGLVGDEKATRGIFVTCSGYTQPALLEAAGKPIELIDGLKLLKMVPGVQTKDALIQPAPRGVPAAVLEASAVQAGDSAVEPVCPKCHGAMILRTARQGLNAGTDFWGCSRYPKCRGTRPKDEEARK